MQALGKLQRRQQASLVRQKAALVAHLAARAGRTAQPRASQSKRHVLLTTLLRQLWIQQSSLSPRQLPATAPGPAVNKKTLGC